MADYYLDVSAVGNEYQAYADTPATWGIPQDGNGKAGPGHSAAVTIATIDCATATCAGAGVIGLLGVTVSSTLTGTGAALATAIAAAINASTTALTATYSQALLPLNRLVFARTHPTTTTLVQIMLRVAGADWNGMAPAYAGTWSVNPIIVAFSGGANGPFGYFTNNTTVFGKAQAAYGFFTLAGAGATTPGLSDTILVRTRRSGAGLTCSLSSATALTLTASGEFNLVFDDGTTWAGDDGQFTLSVDNTSGAVSSSLRTAAGSWNTRKYLRFVARKSGGFRLLYAASTAGSSFGFGLNAQDGGNVAIQQCVFEDSGANGAVYVPGVSGVYCSAHIADCAFILRSNHSVVNAATFYQTVIKFIGCSFTYYSVSADPTALVSLNSTPANSLTIEIRHCVAAVIGGAWKVSTAFSGVANVLQPIQLIADDVSGLRSVSFPWAAALSGGMSPPNHYGFWQSRDGDKPFRYSTPYFTTDWIDDGTYPTAGEILPSGNAWSMRSVWRTSTHVDLPAHVATVYAFFRGATGLKTLTIDLLTPVSGAPSKDQVEIIFGYTDSSGIVRNESSSPVFENAISGGGNPLSPSGKSWALNGLTGYEARKIEITTSYPINQNTEISAALVFVGTPSTDTSVFINPTVGVSDA